MRLEDFFEFLRTRNNQYPATTFRRQRFEYGGIAHHRLDACCLRVAFIEELNVLRLLIIMLKLSLLQKFNENVLSDFFCSPPPPSFLLSFFLPFFILSFHFLERYRSLCSIEHNEVNERFCVYDSAWNQWIQHQQQKTFTYHLLFELRRVKNATEHASNTIPFHEEDGIKYKFLINHKT